ncbi:MAG: type II and III secretion system protein family protein [Novosphingobium sp.]
MRSSLLAIAFAAQSVVGSEIASAQESGSSLHAGALEVPVNKSQVVTADRAIGKAMIGNSEIADVLPISDHSVYVLGKKLGTTSLTLYDRLNHVIAVMDIAVGPDVDGLRRQMAVLIPGQKIDARISNESIILSGMVNDPGSADRAALIAKAFAADKVINLITVGGSQQVMLEVRFAEINRQLGEKLGVNFSGQSLGGTFNGAMGNGAQLVPDANGIGILKLGAITDTFGIFSKAFHIGDTSINGVLDAMERRGLSKTLAEPTLIALSGEKASFLAGGEFPIPVVQGSGSGSTGAGVNNSAGISVQFKPFGVSLSFTPTVLSDKVINLIVEPEVSSIDPSASISIGGLNIPGLQTRRARTTLELRDGESFAIAGLLRRDFQTTVRQLPILGSIPLLGALFRSSNFQKGETELLIVVTPRLVAPIRPDQVRLPTDRIDDPKASDIMIDGEGYHPKLIAPPSPALVPPSAPTSAAPGNPTAKDKGYAY